jgi:hypothetical protein
MNDKFDELVKGLAQSVTRRGALKKFGVGLAGIALAWVGLPGKAQGGQDRLHIGNCNHCDYTHNFGCNPGSPFYGDCVHLCQIKCGGGG